MFSSIRKVPVLQVTKEGKTDYLFQSLPIIEYLEESYPGTYSILPNDTTLRQKTRAMSELVNSGIQPLQNLALLGELGNALQERSPRVLCESFGLCTDLFSARLQRRSRNWAETNWTGRAG